MNNLTLFLLGLVLIYIPTYLSDKSNPEQCFSQALNPSYPCCKGNEVVYIDNDGKWGVENGEWCGIGNNSSNSCFSFTMGYPCCESCEVLYTDDDGNWSVENGNWCGIKDNCENNSTNNDFEFSFLKIENNKENMIYSPLSIEYALTMLQEGAENNTYDEINEIIGNIKLPKYKNINGYLSLANGLFIRDTYYKYVETEYINKLKEKYDAEIIKDEFKSAKNANEWIEDKTLGIIKNMLSDDLVKDPNTLMLIINALAIDMEWYLPFNYESTFGYSFYKDDGQEIKATTMTKFDISNKAISYYINDEITVLTMDLNKYSGTQLEFMVIMPNENLSDYVKKVSREHINQIDKNLILSSNEPGGVNIMIPKFKFSYSLELKKDLQNLGINDAFDSSKADFTKMVIPENPTKKLYVSTALHKADIEFTEKGVKAAAVTIFGLGGGGSPIKYEIPVDIFINKPFMFIIRDKITKDIWFTGTVYEPNLWENDKSEYKYH